MAKIKFDSVLRCANVKCIHNIDGYNCTCRVITLNADGQCALAQPRRKSTPPDLSANANAKVNKPFDMEASK
jgi:hypothetical protein